MLAQELYRRAVATLADVDSLHVAFRSVDYLLRDRCPQCTIMRRYVHYVAPDRICGTWFDCNPVAERQRSDLVQVGTRAYHRQPLATDGQWAEIEPVLKARDDLPAVVAGWMLLPSADDSSGGSRYTTAFHIPILTTITIQGQQHNAIVLPVETQRYPRIYFPGIPPSSGPAPPAIPYQGSLHQASRIVDSGRLFVDALAARPLRYLSAVVATIDDKTSIVLSRSHVCFRYNGVATISLPVTSGPDDGQAIRHPTSR